MGGGAERVAAVIEWAAGVEEASAAGGSGKWGVGVACGWRAGPSRTWPDMTTAIPRFRFVQTTMSGICNGECVPVFYPPAASLQDAAKK
ncbi:hypothetical protein D3C71_1530050 [compost metagenome]